MRGVFIAKMFSRLSIYRLQETRQADTSDLAKVLRRTSELRQCAFDFRFVGMCG
jgi:hypothetical protein